MMEKNFAFSAQEGFRGAILQNYKTKQLLGIIYIAIDSLEELTLGQDIPVSANEKGKLIKIHHHNSQDSILLEVDSTSESTFEKEVNEKAGFIDYLSEIIADRKKADPSSSYTSSLFAKGINKVAQKVGEEAVEIVIEAKDDNKDLFMGEAADLLYHYLVLLEAKDYKLHEVIEVLEARHK
ncbi:phosphoribosyl-ATP diphosphatase [Sediminitomix flava]|uniref:Phosphoribosyl-ATP pyrophosphatase n=2 Tax=Sediminitomix flava TaxID=379075 RepID=A0A315Z8U2_SEDFL|nr:phosphoribosyl-ATP diphosphatase [Sediminitomix flava]PWJ41985.1 phosphoribosyl-ATP pyrophosphatase [Sediminitomix flava]